MLLDIFGEEALDRTATVRPIGRIGRPEEIADAVAWLFSDKSLLHSFDSRRRSDRATSLGSPTSEREYVSREAGDRADWNIFIRPSD
jgi:hypothetical protein